MKTIQTARSKGNRVLITGGMGFIGSHLSEALLKLDYQVTVLDNLSTGSFKNIQHLVGVPGFSFVIEDVKNEIVLDRLASQSDIIFHLAAVVGVRLIVESPMNTIQNNVEGTEIVLKTALRYHSKVFIASTSEVYGKADKIPYSEENDTVYGPSSVNRWAYAASKLIDEFLGLAYYREKGLPVIVFRLFNTVGPRQSAQYGMVLPHFVQQALQGEPLTVFGDGQQSRCFVHVRDVVDALIRLMDCPEAVGQVFNIGSTEEVTILELANRVLELSDAYLYLYGQGQTAFANPISARDLQRVNIPVTGNGKSRIKMMSYKEAYGNSFEDMQRRVPDTSKISKLTDWEPIYSLDQIIQDVLIQTATSQGERRVPEELEK